MFLKTFLPRSVLMLYYRMHYSRYINKLEIDIDSSKKTILAINHFYDQDYEACQLSNEAFNFVVIDGPELFKSAKIFFSQDVQDISTPYAHERKVSLDTWRLESESIFGLLKTRFHFDYLLLPSDTFFWIREFVDIAKINNIVTVILDKEGTISPYDFEYQSQKIKVYCPIIAEYVFVWSQRQKSFWERMNVSPERIFVVGQPRSDLFYLKKTDLLDDIIEDGTLPLIVFFSYHDDAYINPNRNKRRDPPLSWRKMKSETHDIILEMAEKYEGRYNFIIKTHPQQLDLPELKQKYSRTNLKVVGGSSLSNKLIQKAKLIIAFQTTIIIEAMYLNRNVIYTYWDEHIDEIETDLLPFHKAAGIIVTKSREGFHQRLEAFLTEPKDFVYGPEELKAKEAFVEDYIFQPDGKTCERFYNRLKTL